MAKNSENSDRTAGFSLLFFRPNRRKPRISAADEVPLAVNFWKNSEKQRELTRNASGFLDRAGLGRLTDNESATPLRIYGSLTLNHVIRFVHTRSDTSERDDLIGGKRCALTPTVLSKGRR